MAKRRRIRITRKIQFIGLAALTVLTLAVVAWTVLKPTATIEIPPAVAAYTPPPATLPETPKFPEIPSGSQVLLIGDSYALGTGAADRDTGRYAALVSAAFLWNTTIDGVGGTGFTYGNDESDATRFLNRVSTHAANPEMNPKLVILQGGQNDHRAKPEELQAATSQTVAAVKAAWPETSVLVIGPTAPYPLGAKLGRMATPINSGAVSAGAFSINPVRENWFTKDNSPGFDFDKAHVNDAGHKYMAEQIVADIKRLQA